MFVYVMLPYEVPKASSIAWGECLAGLLLQLHCHTLAAQQERVRQRVAEGDQAPDQFDQYCGCGCVRQIQCSIVSWHFTSVGHCCERRWFVFCMLPACTTWKLSVCLACDCAQCTCSGGKLKIRSSRDWLQLELAA